VAEQTLRDKQEQMLAICKQLEIDRQNVDILAPKCGHFGAKMWKKNEAVCSRQTALIVHLKKPLLALQIPRAHTEIVEKVTTAAAAAPVRPVAICTASASASASASACASLLRLAGGGARPSVSEQDCFYVSSRVASWNQATNPVQIWHPQSMRAVTHQ